MENKTMTEPTQQNTNDALKAAFDAYLGENEKYSVKGVKAAGTRARKALADLAKLCKARRTEIQNEKNAAKTP